MNVLAFHPSIYLITSSKKHACKFIEEGLQLQEGNLLDNIILNAISLYLHGQVLLLQATIIQVMMCIFHTINQGLV